MVSMGGMKDLLTLTIYFAKSDMRNRVAGSFGGFVWLVLQPLLLTLLFIFLFSCIIKIKIQSTFSGTSSFPLFLISGLLPWLAFQEALFRAMNSILENREVVKKIYLPLASLPIGYILSVQFVYGVVFFIFSIICLLGGGSFLGFIRFLMLAWLLLLAYSLQTILSIGLGFIFSAIAVYVRDVIQIVPLFLQVWFYLTPIVYPENMVPEKYKFFLEINPFNSFVRIYKLILLKKIFPPYTMWFFPSIFSLFMFIAGFHIFNKLKDGFADVL